MILMVIVYGFLVMTLIPRLESALCNEAVCASVVSKCMLTQSCKCDLTHCSCCKDCTNCLSSLFNQCCSCLDMCPGFDYTHESQVETFPLDVAGLFDALTSVPDPDMRWKTYIEPSLTIDNALRKNRDEDVLQQNTLSPNCTVAYLSQCVTLAKCKTTCGTMGSSGFRFFHDGCCECFGHTCANNGSDESRCLQCGKRPVEDGDEYDDALELDYGENTETEMLD